MITLGTVKFDFLTDNEPFARQLNGRWDTFFTNAFERVADEVLSASDTPDRMITIDSLQLDLGTLPREDFERHFANRLREVLKDYMHRWMNADKPVALKAGVRLEKAGHAALDILCFYLLHGYLPPYTDAGYTDLHFLLAKVIGESAYRFREFLESYGHYDFLCRRLVFSFTDDELEEIVRVVQPSESKFVSLYVRVQLRSYSVLKRPDITKDDYRNVLWTLVLAYLFSESRSRFSRKQVMMHTLRGVAAHFNMKFAQMTGLMTASVQQLERTVGQLPELWSLLKEIRQDVRARLYALDGDYRRHLWREILFALQTDSRVSESDFLLSYVHVCYVLSDPFTCPELLKHLHEPQIHRLVGIIVPSEKEYVISYARLLDKNEKTGMFTGRAGSDFRMLKWEFIFTVLLSVPSSAFSRKQFVLSVVQRLAAHYNQGVRELVRLLAMREAWEGMALPSELLSVLQMLDNELNGTPSIELLPEELPPDVWELWLQTPEQIRRFADSHTEQQIVTFVSRLIPSHSVFIVSYAALLDKGHGTGLLQGKAGGEFRTLKWEFILSYLSMDRGVAFNRQVFVYSVLQRLAAHYNQEVTELIAFFLQELSSGSMQSSFAELKTVLEIIRTSFRQISNPPHSDVEIQQFNLKAEHDPRQWAIALFGSEVPAQVSGRETYLEKWLTYFLNEQNEIFRILWRAGRLNTSFLLQLVNHKPALRSLWLHRIGDERLLAIYRRWHALYEALGNRLREYGFLEPAGEYLSVWMVELTSRSYSAWSEAEITRFLLTRVRGVVPPGLVPLMENTLFRRISNPPCSECSDKPLIEITQYISELKNEEIMEQSKDYEGGIEMRNAGLVLLSPYFPMLFHRTGLLTEDRKDFKDLESRIRAIFLLQYLVFGEQPEWPETDLYLNKLLVGMDPTSQPLPRKVELLPAETDLMDSLLQSVCHTWDKMRNTSVAGFQHTFLQRMGVVLSDERMKIWTLKVEEKAFDVLLDSVPWGFKLVRFPWMSQRMEVNWR